MPTARPRRVPGPAWHCLPQPDGRGLHGGRQVATAEGRLVGPDGRLYAHATTTCLIFDTPP